MKLNRANRYAVAYLNKRHTKYILTDTWHKHHVRVVVKRNVKQITQDHFDLDFITRFEHAYL